MRDIPIELAARIESGAATLCHAWVVTRADGGRLGFTDHDRDLVVDGVVCRAASGWTKGAAEVATGLAAGAFAVDATTGVVTLEGAPGAGVAVTAGFLFDTPVRFDADRLEVTLESFDAGRMAAVPLVGVRV